MSFQTAVTSADELERYVFSTLLEPSPDIWTDFGSLQIGVGYTSSEQAVHVVIYRSRSNHVCDLTTAVDLAISSDSSITISLDANKVAASDVQCGFAILVSSWGSKPTFQGTLNRIGGAPETWTGQYVAIDGSALSALLGPATVIPPKVQSYLNLSPSSAPTGSEVDRAKQWGIDIFQDLMLHSLSLEGQQDFFKDIGTLGSYFASKDLHSKSILSDSCLSAEKGPFSLSSIQSHNKDLFETLGVHVICHALKTASWLDSVYASHIVDLADAFIAMLTCSDADLPEKMQSYGVNMPVMARIHDLRVAYVDAATRCYLAGWVVLCPELDPFHDVQGSIGMLQRITSAVTSDSYKTHSLEIDAGAPSDESATMFSIQLGVLRNKLVLLELLSGGSTRWADWSGIVGDFDKTISQLEEGAAATGLFGQSDVAMRSKDFTLQPTLDNIFDEQHLDLKRITDVVAPNSVIAVMGGMPDIEYVIDAVNKYLLASAGKLGLYTQPSGPALAHSPQSCMVI